MKNLMKATLLCSILILTSCAHHKKCKEKCGDCGSDKQCSMKSEVKTESNPEVKK